MRIASGISATDGIGRRNSMIGRSPRYTNWFEPMSIPSGIAITAAMPSPSAQPWSVCPTAVQKLVESGRYSYSDIALFYRVSALSRVFEDRLRQFNIPHRVIGGLTNAEITAAEAVFQDFVTRDIPAMTRGNMIPSLTIRRAPTPLTSLTALEFGQWWPSPSDIGANRDLAFDAIFVLWQRVGVDQFSGREEYLSTISGNSGELFCSGPNCQIYAALGVAGAGLADFGLINLKPTDAACARAGEDLYAKLIKAGLDPLYDDRDERAGAKFADMDLIGLPWQIVIGPRGVASGQVELKIRATGEKAELGADAAIARIKG